MIPVPSRDGVSHFLAWKTKKLHHFSWFKRGSCRPSAAKTAAWLPAGKLCIFKGKIDFACGDKLKYFQLQENLKTI
jgi:hypothetical protein